MTASCLSRAFIAFLISLTSLSVYAQTPGRKDSDRERVLSEIRNYKHDILVKTLDLTKDQQREFFRNSMPRRVTLKSASRPMKKPPRRK